MPHRILLQRATHLLASGLSVVAQRLPFIKQLTPLLGSPVTFRVATPLVISFAGTDSLSGASPTVDVTGGSTNPAIAAVGEEFLWFFRTRGETSESYSISPLPPGLVYTFGSPISSISGIPAVGGDFSIEIVAWEKSGQRGDHTPTYTFNLEITRDATPFETWTQSRWTGEDLTNPAISGPTADPDQDGITNLLEFVLNLDPTHPEAFPGSFTADPEDETKMIYSLPFNPDAEGMIKFQESTSLKGDEWTDIDPETSDAEITTSSDSVTLKISKAGSPKKLLRLVATVPA
ncbi:hypothetical protein V2O64_24675 (plasmid) [Verrucomicrobiaceae bacterium 227]